MWKDYVLSILVNCISMGAIGQDWNLKTVDFRVKPSIAVDRNGEVQIGYMLEALPGFVNHAQLVGDEFVLTNIDSAYYYGPLAMTVDQQNRPAIALHNHDDEDQNIYWKNAGQSWSRLQVDHAGHDGWDNSIAFDSQNRPRTSSIDPSQFGSIDGVEYAWYDG